jgi:Kef-type K+ transport system membrane component KefB
VDDVVSIDTLAAVAAVSLVAAVVVGLFPRLPVPQVVLLLAGGMVLGPHVLDVGAAQDV